MTPEAVSCCLDEPLIPESFCLLTITAVDVEAVVTQAAEVAAVAVVVTVKLLLLEAVELPVMVATAGKLLNGTDDILGLEDTRPLLLVVAERERTLVS